MNQQPVTYHQLLADTYEENARNTLVYREDDGVEETVEPMEEHTGTELENHRQRE